jgi:hypothetical protein
VDWRLLPQHQLPSQQERDLELAESGIKYWLVDVKTKSGPRRAALTCINGQGQGMATAHTERSVIDTNCRVAFLVGFCAGLLDKTDPGEVITSRTIIGYEPARLEAEILAYNEVRTHVSLGKDAP